ncbi:MAG TPA: formylglycine-generating enzyme family protein [Labilithrix sp.]|jgi:formylglycine-generating enzyme required for sulfatase activity
MGRGAVVAALAVGVLGACNALSGVSDLALCDGDCDGGVAVDAGPDATNFVEAGPDGALPPGCKDGDVTCAGSTAAQCVMGNWTAQDCAETCELGQCVRYPSCRGEAADGCGTTSSSCCESIAVPAAIFNRRNSASYSAIVSNFSLDRFEVTVGRFRAYVASGGATQASPPAAGAGANPTIPGSGWQSAWNASLPATTAAITANIPIGGTSTWTPMPGANEHKPINNVDWLDAFAFCAWDGGRLPTFAEWEAAAAGGSEQRFYPWSTPPTDSLIDGTPIEAAYNCNFQDPAQVCDSLGCSGCATDVSDIADVGLLPGGEAKWGHRDLGGNVAEWLLDVSAPLGSTCVDCACLYSGAPDMGTTLCEGAGPKNRPMQLFVAGGGWRDGSGALQIATNTPNRRWSERHDDVGFRCAR